MTWTRITASPVLLVALGTTACTPPPPAARRPTRGWADDRVCVAPPPATLPAPVRAWCQSPATAPGSGTARPGIRFEFEPDAIHPDRHDPPAAAGQGVDAPRHAVSVRRQLEDGATALGACYRWASGAGPARPARLRAAFTVDPWGHVRDVAVLPDAPSTDPLARCAADVLAGLRILPAVARRTRVTLTLRFRPAVPGAAVAPTARPGRRDPPAWPGRACLPGPPALPEDELALGDTVAPVTDFDWTAYCEKNEAERIAKHCEKARAAGLSCRVQRRRCAAGGRWDVTVRPYPRPPEVRRAFRRHLGDLQACWREARSRRPGLKGTITITARWLAGGLPESATVSGDAAADATLAACVQRVATRVTLPLSPSDLAVHVTYPLELIPDDPADAGATAAGLTTIAPRCLTRRRAEAHAAASLAARDGEEALRWTLALRAGAPAGARCRLDAQAVAAAVLATAWEAPVLDPLLAAFVQDVRRSSVGWSCWLELTEALAPALRESLERGPVEHRLEWVEATTRRLGLLLGSDPPRDWAPSAAFARAHALRLLGRYGEAAAAFRRLATQVTGELSDRALAESADCEEQVVRTRSGR